MKPAPHAHRTDDRFNLEFVKGKLSDDGRKCGDPITIVYCDGAGGRYETDFTLKVENISLRSITDLAQRRIQGSASTAGECEATTITVVTHPEAGKVVMGILGINATRGDPPFALSWAEPGTTLPATRPALKCPAHVQLRAKRTRFGLLACSWSVGGHHHIRLLDANANAACAEANDGTGAAQAGTGSGAPGSVTASDALKVVRIDLLDSEGRVIATSNGTGVIRRQEDYRERITIRATNFLGMNRSCNTVLTTFTTAAGWDSASMETSTEPHHTGREYRLPAPKRTSNETRARGGGCGCGNAGGNTNPGPCGQGGGGSGGNGGNASEPSAFGTGSGLDSGAGAGWLFVSYANPSAEGRDIVFEVDVVPKRAGLLFVDQTSGAVVVSPKAEHVCAGAYAATLRGVDSEGARAVVKRWNFTVIKAPKFRLNDTTWDPTVLGHDANFHSRYERNKTYELGSPTATIAPADLFVGNSLELADITYSVEFKDRKSQVLCQQHDR